MVAVVLEERRRENTGGGGSEGGAGGRRGSGGTEKWVVVVAVGEVDHTIQASKLGVTEKPKACASAGNVLVFDIGVCGCVKAYEWREGGWRVEEVELDGLRGGSRGTMIFLAITIPCYTEHRIIQ